MNKVSYHNLKLKTNIPIETFDFNGQTIEVKQYLPSEEKCSLITITLQESKENGIFNPLKLDLIFHLNIIYSYTNLVFTEKQQKEPFELYDCLSTNGLIALVLEHMNEQEYKELLNWTTQMVNDTMQYKNTAAAVLQSLVNDLPQNAAAAEKIVENFDPSKYQAVVDFAKAANGGRPISGINKNREVTE